MRVESEVGNDGTRTEAFLELCKGVGRARECKQESGAGEEAEERQVVLVVYVSLLYKYQAQAA